MFGQVALSYSINREPPKSKEMPLHACTFFVWSESVYSSLCLDTLITLNLLTARAKLLCGTPSQWTVATLSWHRIQVVAVAVARGDAVLGKRLLRPARPGRHWRGDSGGASLLWFLLGQAAVWCRLWSQTHGIPAGWRHGVHLWLQWSRPAGPREAPQETRFEWEGLDVQIHTVYEWIQCNPKTLN